MANKPNKPKPKRQKLDIWNRIAVCVLTLFLVGCISVFFILVNVINDPDGMHFSKDGLSTLSNSRIYDGAGELVFEFGDEIREDVSYEQIPQSVIDAFLSIEDSRYFDHNGFDLPRFMAAALNNLRRGDLSQGGSTLTMQMIDNAFTKNKEEKLKNEGKFTKVQNIKLKIQEIYLALIAEQNIGKEDIFEYYVNRIWFGSGGNTRGIQKASHYFFGKDISELNLNESAFLAGCINAPASYNPMNNIGLEDPNIDFLASATNRRNVTLQMMQNHGYITEDEYLLAISSPLEFSLDYKETISSNANQAFIDQTIEECKRLTGQDPSIIPMDIYTSLNQDVQKYADEICNGNVIPFPNEAFDIGFGVIDNDTGEIIAVAPGRRYHSDQIRIDNSTDRKQPGSSMKPLLAYAPTFDILGWSTVHQVNDKPKDFFHNGVPVKNSDGRYDGPMSLEKAIGVSKNTTAMAAMVDLVDETGLNYWVDYCEKLGYDEDVYENFVEQYAIGGADMWASPIQQASAYSTFANGGKREQAHRIRRVVRRADKAKFEFDEKADELVSSEAAFMISQLLEKVVTGGYMNFNNLLTSNYPVYAKSGTSDWGDVGLQYGIPQGVIRDEWSCAYTSDFSIAVWSGYTLEYQKQGYYIDMGTLNYATAFHISKAVLDYCQQYGDYKPIQKPKGVSPYKNGYIKTEFKNKGDDTHISTPTEEEKRMACEADGGEWDSNSQTCLKEDELENKNACEATGGLWSGGSCICPEGTQQIGNSCEVVTPTPSPEPDIPTPSPEPEPEPEPSQPVQVFDMIRGFFNIFNWI